MDKMSIEEEQEGILDRGNSMAKTQAGEGQSVSKWEVCVGIRL